VEAQESEVTCWG